MSPASSTKGTRGEGISAMPSKIRNLVNPQKPDIKISFQSQQKVYTTLDRIEGTVIITPQLDTPFDSIEIEFVGTSRTYVERLTTAAAASGRSEAFHQFLKLSQPGLSDHYPLDQILKAGVSYELPFLFAVPQQLLPRVCQHTVRNEAIREAHLRLPPTFGDKDLTNRQKSLDDMAPEMASVRYGIFAKISEIKVRGDEAWRATVCSKARRVRVIPAVEEQPPLDVRSEDGEYVMRKEKTMRKGMLKGKTGTLVMEAAQPQALKVRSYDNPEARTNTMANIMLRYEPIDESSPPPKLGNLASKLKVTTYFASTARNTTPTKYAAVMDLSQGLHGEQFNLSSRCMANVEWTKHQSSKPERRDSTLSTSSFWASDIPEPSASYKGKTYYTARLVVPIQLPTTKAFVPSFHSCLISRVYALKLELGVSSLGIGPSMDLKVPIQISSEGLVGELERRESVDSANDSEIDVEDVSNFFTNFLEPRTIRVPSENFIGRSRIGSQAPVSEDAAASDPERAQSVPSGAPPGYSPAMGGETARMCYHRASLTVPVH